MDPRSEPETGSDPLFGSDDWRDRSELNSMSISELVSELRDTFLRSDFDRVEETLVAREARLKAEIEEKKREIGLLQEKVQFERLEKISVEMELKRVKQERHVEENGNEFSLDVSNKAVKAELGRESCELEALENAREMRRMKLRAKRNIMDQDGASNALTPQRQSSESLPRNSPPAKKKKRPVGESSPNTPFEANLFRSAEHQRKYENKMEGKAFVSEKSFDLGNLREYPEIKMQIQNRKWEALMTVPRLFSAQVVKEFYVNVYTESKGKDQFKSFVRGKEVKFHSRSINKMLKIPEVECEYEEMVSRDLGEEEAKVILDSICHDGVKWKTTSGGDPQRIQASQLTATAYAWSNFVHHTLLPCPNVSDVKVSRALLIFCILTGKWVNVGNILAKSILTIARSEKVNAALGHPSLVQWLCQKSKVSQFPLEAKVKQAAPITDQWINTKYNRKQERVRATQQQFVTPADHVPPPSTSTSVAVPLNVSSNDLLPILEEILRNQREIRADHTSLRRDIQSVMEVQQPHDALLLHMAAQLGIPPTGTATTPPVADMGRDWSPIGRCTMRAGGAQLETTVVAGDDTVMVDTVASDNLKVADEGTVIANFDPEEDGADTGATTDVFSTKFND